MFCFFNTIRILIYCYNTSGRKIHKYSYPLVYLAAIITIVVLVNNYFHGFAFYVSGNTILRGDDYWMAIAGPMLYIAASLVLCFIFFVRNRKATEEKRNISLHMLVAIGITSLGALACAFVSFVSPWYTFVAAMVYLYMRLHGYRERNLDILAYTDSLTGLKNHAMYSVIKENMDKRIRTEQNLRFAVAVMDVNFLKQINDACGHRAGDDLLINASRRICNTFDHSPVCRIGGDEFVAILEGYDYDNRESLRVQFEETMLTATFVSEGRECPLSIAIGIRDFSEKQHKSFEEVFHGADEAMYENKDFVKKQRVFQISCPHSPETER